MRSNEAYKLFHYAEVVARHLQRITITDPIFPYNQGNVTIPTKETQMHSLATVMSGIRGAGGNRPSLLGGRHIVQTKQEWIVQGNRTLAFGKGICTDCAAVAGATFLSYVNKIAIKENREIKSRIEIISDTEHAYVVVNREGPLETLVQWGLVAFVLDIWIQNQFRINIVKGVFWADDFLHIVGKTILENQPPLMVEVILRE